MTSNESRTSARRAPALAPRAIRARGTARALDRPVRLEDYAIVGDTQTVALISRAGSVDWLCFPRFDSGACFAALLGTPEHGRWSIAPRGEVRATRRRYRGDTLVLETELDTDDGTIRLVDFMPVRGKAPDLARIVEGVRGRVDVRMELVVRYDYGSIVPWIRSRDGRVQVIAGADALVLATPLAIAHDRGAITADFTVAAGERVPMIVTWHPSHQPPPPSPDVDAALDDTVRHWQRWSRTYRDDSPYSGAVMRSLLTLEALTYRPSGGLVAAATTSLPEALGGPRNWDYRYCWLRDATFTLQSMLHAGFRDEARAWRDWLVRAIAGEPARLQTLYGVAGERRIDERTLDWLPGYQGSRPVRIGNAAVGQLQLDVFGEVIDMLYHARVAGLSGEPDVRSIERALLDWLESNWHQPDDGMWESRGGREQFTHSKVMVWTAFDRAVKTCERFGGDGPVDRWRALRAEVHDEVCRRGFDRARGAFTRSYGSSMLDASLLLMPIVGFLPGDDPRVVATIDAIDRELSWGDLVRRYPTGDDASPDGLTGKEGAFVACAFWMVDALYLAGRVGAARARFERLLRLGNDVGLFAEEYDPDARRQLGNFPQAFSHVALINSAHNLSRARGPALERASRAHGGS